MKKFIKQKKYIGLLTAILLILLCFAANMAEKHFYDQYSISQDILIDDAMDIKEFEAREGRLYALSDDPWIEYSSEKAARLKKITIDVNYLSDNYKNSEIYVMHSDGSFTRYDITLVTGSNDLVVREKDISSIRFDLLTSKDSAIGINTISFNHDIPSLFNDMASALSSRLYLLPVIIRNIAIPFILLLTGAAIIAGKIGVPRTAAALSAVLILYIFSVVFSYFVLYREIDYDFDELAKRSSDYEIDAENSRLTSLTYDSWIYVPYAKANDVRIITVNVNEWIQSEDDAQSELFLFYNDKREKYDHITFTLKEGENVIYIPEHIRKLNAFRFDFTYASGVSIGLESIAFNSRSKAAAAFIKDICGYMLKLFVWLLLLAFLYAASVYSRRLPADESFIRRQTYSFISALMLVLSLVLCFKTGISAILPMAGVCLFMCRSIDGYGDKMQNSLFAALCALFSAWFAFLLIPQMNLSDIFFISDGAKSIRLFISLFCGCVFVCALLSVGISKEKACNAGSRLISMLLDAVIISVMTAGLEIMAKIFFENLSFAEAASDFLTSRTIWLNIVLWGVIYLFFRNILGGIFGRIAGILLYLFFFIGNFVKLKYHDAVFLPMDFLQIKDFMGIVTRYVPMSVLLLAAALIVGIVVFFAVRYRKKLLNYKPNVFMAAACAAMVVLLSGFLTANSFISMGYDVTQNWLIAKECVKNEGVVTYSYTKFRELLKIFPKPDENYSREYMLGLKANYDKEHTSPISAEKPNVILIMEESMFDVGSVPDVSFSEPVDNNIRKYKKADTISPKYGGGTASVEFEALTGMSNFFFLDNIVPYVTYWNSGDEYIPGIAQEFKKSGYSTTAIHPNEGGYYNRNFIYSAMGFDRFIQKKDLDYSAENVADDGWFKDIPLADVIENEMNSTDAPQFIFTVTVENHMLYESKYDETEIKLSSDRLDGNELHQLEQYSEGVLHANRFIEKMVNIVDNAKRPTILYIWGDHLPALSAFNTLGFIDDKYNKYATPLIAYSNYKDIEIGQDYITPNQLAPQILKDSQIDYSSYFDFVYSLRQDFPVVQKEFGIDPENERIKEYGEVQYDLLFGEQYLLENSP